MPSPSATFVKTADFLHLGQRYTVGAYVEPTDPETTHVEVVACGQPVVITYPDGLRGRLSYSVSMMTRVDLAISQGINAVNHLMQTAEKDIRQLVR